MNKAMRSAMVETPNQPDLPKAPDITGAFYFFVDIYKFGSSEAAQLILTTVGGFVVVSFLFKVINWFLSVLQSPVLAIYRHFEDDAWAVVTGASDGLGRAFSEELLRRGFNVLLHGRNAQKLERVKKELLDEWPKRKVDIVVADASKHDNAYETIVKKAKSLDGKVTVLVNNVGGQTTTPRFKTLRESKHEDLDICINTNARFPTHLTAAMLPLLQENKPSLIINLGSTGGMFGTPYLATYTATKAYIHILTESLRFEMIAEETPEVEVKGFIVGNTATAGNPGHMPFFTLEARECAASCLDRIGKGGGAVVFSHWRHALQHKIFTVLPKSIVDREMVKEMNKRVKAEEEELGLAKKDK